MSQLPAEIWKWSAVDTAQSIRSGLISCRDAVRASVDRMAEVNPQLNAIVVDLSDDALRDADRADAARSRGDTLGPLHGVPVSVKINVDQRGQATSNGVREYAKNIAQEDSPVVANLRAAGAIIIGRNNTPAFSHRWVTDNALHGRTLNPWSRDHTPGGSSGGASASVAAGITAIAHGNDLAGSIRYPAYCTGILGLRPSFGRVPAFNPSATAERSFSTQLMSVQGPLTRCVADMRLALQVMSKGDVRDPWWVPAPLAGANSVKPLRVALSIDPSGDGVDPRVAEAVRQAAKCLADAGYVVEEVDPPHMREAAQDWHVLARAEAHEFMAEAVRLYGDDEIQKAFFWHMMKPGCPSPEQYMQALARRAKWVRGWQQFMEQYPLVLCPVSLAPPFLQGADVASEDSLQEIVRIQASCFAVPLLGLPAVSAPTGVVDGLPMGVQIIGRRFREDEVLDAAECLERRVGMTKPIDVQF